MDRTAVKYPPPSDNDEERRKAQLEHFRAVRDDLEELEKASAWMRRLITDLHSLLNV